MKNSKFAKIGNLVGGVMTTLDLAWAAEESYIIGSIKPFVAESIRQIGAWGGAIGAGKLVLWRAGIAMLTRPQAIAIAIPAVLFAGALGYSIGNIFGNMVYKR